MSRTPQVAVSHKDAVATFLFGLIHLSLHYWRGHGLFTKAGASSIACGKLFGKRQLSVLAGYMRQAEKNIIQSQIR